MSTIQLRKDLLQIEVETFEIVDLTDTAQDFADLIEGEIIRDGLVAATSSSCSCSSCCSCSTSSCCSCSTSTSSCG